MNLKKYMILSIALGYSVFLNKNLSSISALPPKPIPKSSTSTSASDTKTQTNETTNSSEEKLSHVWVEYIFRIAPGGVNPDWLGLSEDEKRNLENVRANFEKYRRNLNYDDVVGKQIDESVFGNLSEEDSQKMRFSQQGTNKIAEKTVELKGGVCRHLGRLMVRDFRNSGFTASPILFGSPISDGKNRHSAAMVKIRDKLYVSDLVMGQKEDLNGNASSFLIPLSDYLFSGVAKVKSLNQIWILTEDGFVPGTVCSELVD